MSDGRKFQHSASEQKRFHTNVRHYHRPSASPAEVPILDRDGRPVPKPAPRWLKILGIVTGTLALAGIVSGLIIELSA